MFLIIFLSLIQRIDEDEYLKFVIPARPKYKPDANKLIQINAM